jgi:hypothetical protein
MATTYEIFRNGPRGAIWVESAEGLAQATERLKRLNEINHTEYFAYDVAEARIIAKVPFESRSANAETNAG